MKSSVKPYLEHILTHKNHIYRAVALSKYRKASFEVSKFGFHFLAVIRIALENRSRDRELESSFRRFKMLMSIFF